MIASQKLFALLVILFTAEHVLGVDSRWTRLFKDEDKEETTTSTSKPATLNSVINTHRSFLKPKTTVNNVGFENAELQQPNQKLIKREEPVTFTQELPSGVTFSSYSSSSSSRMVDGKWVTETTETTVKPDGEQNRLRGTTTKETSIEPMTKSSSRVNNVIVNTPMVMSSPFEDLDDGGFKFPSFDAFRPFSTMSFFNRIPPVFPQGNNGNPLRVSTSLLQNQPQTQSQSQPQQLRIRQINAEEESNETKA